MNKEQLINTLEADLKYYEAGIREFEADPNFRDVWLVKIAKREVCQMYLDNLKNGLFD